MLEGRLNVDGSMASTDTSPFRYEILDLASIRLLKPISIRPDRLHFEICHVLRSEAKDYTAISYAWGDEAATEEICLNGRTFRVRPNLWSCLSHICQIDRSKFSAAWLYIWIDAVCINQSNVLERSVQVRYMGEVYKSAVSVTAWLGPALRPGPSYIDTSTPLQKQSPGHRLIIGQHRWRPYLSDIGNRVYWTRYWIIQEIMLAQVVDLVCGNTVIPYDEVDLSVRCTGRLPQPFRANAILQNCRLPSSWPHSRTLDRFLADFASQLCSDRRDKIFGLLGVLQSRERKELEKFFPNYALNDEEVAVLTMSYFWHFKLAKPSYSEAYKHVPDHLGLPDDPSYRRRLLTYAQELDYDGISQGRLDPVSEVRMIFVSSV